MWVIESLTGAIRREGSDSLKAVKDRLQAEFLIAVLASDRPEDLHEALEDALARGKRWRERITASVLKQPLLQETLGAYL